MEPVSITALIVSIITALGILISKIKMKHCLCGCIESDCITTPITSPETSETSSDITVEPQIYITHHTPHPSPTPSRKITTDV
jgi:hypothetical protein